MTVDKTITAQAYPLRPYTIVYIVLVMLTIITWMIGRTGLTGLDITLFVLLLALIKGLLIGDYFMGLKCVDNLWRWSIRIWLLIPGSLIAWAFITSI